MIRCPCGFASTSQRTHSRTSLQPVCHCSNARATHASSITCRRPVGCGRSIPKLEAKSVIPLFCSIMFKARRIRRLKGRMLLEIYLRQNYEADPERKQLAQLQKKDSSRNDRCCDCNAPSPQWVCHAVLVLPAFTDEQRDRRHQSSVSSYV